MNMKPVVTFVSLVLGLAFVGSTGLVATAASVPSKASVVTIPEVNIMGELSPANIINLPEQVITASPTPKAKASRGVNAPSKGLMVRSHTLHQGGRPGAQSVVYWDNAR